MEIQTKQGFTLIELLVVIAIIGLLSAIVLASLNSARNKGQDSAVKSQLANLRPQAAIVHDSLGSYGTNGAAGSTGTTTCARVATCSPIVGSSGVWADATFKNAIQNLANNAVNNASGLAVYAGGWSSTYWAVAAVLPSDSTKAWCVDSLGQSRQMTTMPTSAASFGGCK